MVRPSSVIVHYKREIETVMDYNEEIGPPHLRWCDLVYLGFAFIIFAGPWGCGVLWLLGIV